MKALNKPEITSLIHLILVFSFFRGGIIVI